MHYFLCISCEKCQQIVNIVGNVGLQDGKCPRKRAAQLRTGPQKGLIRRASLLASQSSPDVTRLCPFSLLHAPALPLLRLALDFRIRTLSQPSSGVLIVSIPYRHPRPQSKPTVSTKPLGRDDYGYREENQNPEPRTT